MRGLITQLLTATTPAHARSPGVVPGEPGVYAWWLSSAPDELPEIPLQPRHDNGLSLLYVGIAPRRPSSRQTLRTRIIGNHLRGNVGASTFRLSLAALLWEREGWRPHWRSTRVQLPPEDNAALTRWQEQHLRVAWATHAQPWLVEADVIATMHPPLNLADNATNDFTATMAEARARLRDAARAASQR